MTTNSKGKALIKQFEGMQLVAYKDSAGISTIGYGHTGQVPADMEITIDEAEVLFLKDLGVAEKAVNRLVTVPITQNQFSALVSFVYNEGDGKFMCSTLLKKLIAQDYEGASSEFLRWDKGHSPDGKVVELQGLRRRRLAEQQLFNSTDD